MNQTKRLILLSLCLAAGAVAQTRDDVFDFTNVTVTRVMLFPLEDGGCSAQWCGHVVSTDGGTTLTGCTERDLALPLSLGRCAGLATTGVRQLARSLRIDVDAGVP